MKNIIKITLLSLVAFVFAACQQDQLMVEYPASTPKIDSALVKETLLTYGDSIHGDSIHVRVTVSDNVTPLSTLKLYVVVSLKNERVNFTDTVISETFRTKGNTSSIKRAYRIPFVANKPDDADIQVHLTETNVSGFVKDTIVSTTKGKRPLNKNTDGTPILVTDYYLVPDFGQGSTSKLILMNADSMTYKVTGLNLKTAFSFKIATKLDKFKRIDWTGMVFG